MRTVKKPIALICAAAMMFISAVGFSMAQDAAIAPKQKAAFEKLIRDYLVSNPKVMQEIINSWQNFQRQNQQSVERQRIDNMRTAVVANKTEVFKSKFDFSTGNPKASVTMVEFFDYNCGFCKRSLPDILTLLKTDKDLRLVVKEFPILGAGSIYASRAAIASKKQGKYWEFHIKLMSTRGINAAQIERIAKEIGIDFEKLKKDMQAPEVTQEIEANLKLARSIGINGTPAFIIADRPVPGAVGIDILRTQIADVRAKGGCKIC